MNSLEYWRNREDRQTRLYQKDEKQVEKEIEEIYQNTLDNVEKEIYSFYAKYASKEEITINEAKKRVTKADIAEYEKKAEKYVKLASQDRAKGTDANDHIYFSKKANEEMALYNLTMKVNRLEMLKSKIGLELAKGNAEAEAKMQKQLEKRSLEEMKRQAGILGKTLVNQDKKVSAIVNGSFHNATFSDRIWANQSMLKNKIDTLLQQGMIQGKGARELAKNIRKEFNVTTYQAERLMRTELARVQIETQKESYIRNGFEEYEFIANSGCCDTCQALNGKIFKVKKMMPGENAAPIHPNCRCSTAPYEDSKEYEAWLDFLDKGGTTEQWKEFKKSGVNTLKSSYNEGEIKKINNTLQKVMDANKVKYNPVSKLKEKLQEIQIIERIGGPDKTDGSCASLSLVYAGNKAGLDVLDFRGGISRKVFSRTSNLKEIAKLSNVKAYYEKGFNDIKNATNLLTKMEKDKEFILITGRHAAVVKHTDEGYLYLELQSSSSMNGFQKLTTDRLKKRFGCTKQCTFSGIKLEQESFLIDVDSLGQCEEFQDLLGYINTNENKQMKGAGGRAK